jgi:hypothetical protein
METVANDGTRPSGKLIAIRDRSTTSSNIAVKFSRSRLRRTWFPAARSAVHESVWTRTLVQSRPERSSFAPG